MSCLICTATRVLPRPVSSRVHQSCCVWKLLGVVHQLWSYTLSAPACFPRNPSAWKEGLWKNAPKSLTLCTLSTAESVLIVVCVERKSLWSGLSSALIWVWAHGWLLLKWRFNGTVFWVTGLSGVVSCRLEDLKFWTPASSLCSLARWFYWVTENLCREAGTGSSFNDYQTVMFRH